MEFVLLCDREYPYQQFPYQQFSWYGNCSVADCNTEGGDNHPTHYKNCRMTLGCPVKQCPQQNLGILNNSSHVRVGSNNLWINIPKSHHFTRPDDSPSCDPTKKGKGS